MSTTLSNTRSRSKYSELADLGQSLWLDYIHRSLITSGKLKEMIAQGLRGITSNPTIFEKAISGSMDYDESLRTLAVRGKTADEIYLALVLKDIQDATDSFRPLYEKTGGADGFVSLEVSPHLAHDTKATIAEAKKLFKLVDRPNVMIKIPATRAGLPAITEVIAAGINVNVTLIFSVERYVEVTQAYWVGLERLAESGGKLDGVVSVASVFVSRIDAKLDKILAEHGLKDLEGRCAVANSKVIYQKFKEVFGGESFGKLKKLGARVQRPLWASTGTKNPKYSDCLYVDTLIGRDTVNTLPPATLEAVLDHATAHLSIEHDVSGAERILSRLVESKIGFPKVMQELEDEGVRQFVESFDQLMKTIQQKRESLMESNPSFRLGKYEQKIGAAVAALEQQGWLKRFWNKDASLWKTEPEAARVIQNRLGWQDIVETMLTKVDELKSFAGEIKKDGFSHVVLLGMGGSSLAPWVLRESFGRLKGASDFSILDSTDPDEIVAREASVDLAHTLFIVSSKSGGTTETSSFFKYFYERLISLKGDQAGENFVAITDPGTLMEALAREKNFRRVFLGEPTVGGRFSGLSYFGMVPAALQGIDLKKFLERILEVKKNPEFALKLGVALAEFAKSGKDKMTLVTSDEIASTGDWIEQLMAESVGKEGKGIVPVMGEALESPLNYGNDRVFVCMKLKSSKSSARLEDKIKMLEKAAHPVIEIELQDVYDLGAAFYTWEVATSVAGSVLGVNPFDEPNVAESKDNTKKVLAYFEDKGKLPVVADECTFEKIKELPKSIESLLKKIERGDYVALLAYTEYSKEYARLLSKIRSEIQRKFRVATTVGFGPRYLHSTGQLHKGGAANGIFIQITGADQNDRVVPGEKYSFSILKEAQALGDYESLKTRKRRLLRINFGTHLKEGLEKLGRMV